MSGRKKAGQYRVLAIVWTLAALSMLVGVIRQLPCVNKLGLVILALSVAAAALWWSAYLKTKAPKNRDSK